MSMTHTPHTPGELTQPSHQKVGLPCPSDQTQDASIPEPHSIAPECLVFKHTKYINSLDRDVLESKGKPGEWGGKGCSQIFLLTRIPKRRNKSKAMAAVTNILIELQHKYMHGSSLRG